jgi:ankyrin repeat protein
MNRGIFISRSLLIAGGVLLPQWSASSPGTTEDRYSPELIREFVSAGHNNLPKVKELLAEFPNLIPARHHLGKGDFEEAIEGASHVGDKEIARYLIEKGARLNIFTMTMLGMTQTVKDLLVHFPALLNARGAHGFSLLHHAKRGGEESKELHDHLVGLGLKELKFKL